MFSGRRLRSLILLLASLQLAMPFLHAHLGKIGVAEGFHVPGLEFVSSFNTHPEMQRMCTVPCQKEQIIGMGSALQSDYQTDSTDDILFFFFLTILLFLAMRPMVHRFYSYAYFVVKEPFAYFSPPRAPPHISFNVL